MLRPSTEREHLHKHVAYPDEHGHQDIASPSSELNYSLVISAVVKRSKTAIIGNRSR
jgi:hypothetical protein